MITGAQPRKRPHFRGITQHEAKEVNKSGSTSVLKTRTEKRDKEAKKEAKEHKSNQLNEADRINEHPMLVPSPKTKAGRRQRALFLVAGLGFAVFALSQYNNKHSTYTIPFVL